MTIRRRARSVTRQVAASLRRVLIVGVAIAGLALAIAGVALIYPPAALILSGVALLAFLTFDPSAAGRLTWPR